MEKIQLIFSKSKLPFSPLVQLVTWSKWSHVGIVANDGKVIESTFSHDGVKLAGITEFMARASDWIIVEMECTNRQAIIDAAMSQLDKPYDWTGLMGILFHNRNWEEEDSWFCSELVAWAFSHAGDPLFMDEVIHRITPQMLFMLPHDVVVMKSS